MGSMFRKYCILILALSFFGLAAACGGGDDETAAGGGSGSPVAPAPSGGGDDGGGAETPAPAAPATVEGIAVENASFVKGEALPEATEPEGLRSATGPPKLVEGETITVQLELGEPTTIISELIASADRERDCVIIDVNFTIAFSDTPEAEPWNGRFRIGTSRNVTVEDGEIVSGTEKLLPVNFSIQKAFFDWYREERGEAALERLKQRGVVICVFQLVYKTCRLGNILGYSNPITIRADFPEEKEEVEPEPSGGEPSDGEPSMCLQGILDTGGVGGLPRPRSYCIDTLGAIYGSGVWRSDVNNCVDLGYRPDCGGTGQGLTDVLAGLGEVEGCPTGEPIWIDFGNPSSGVCEIYEEE